MADVMEILREYRELETKLEAKYVELVAEDPKTKVRPPTSRLDPSDEEEVAGKVRRIFDTKRVVEKVAKEEYSKEQYDNPASIGQVLGILLSRE